MVFAAYDPQLDRRVAIKLLPSKRIGAEARLRLLREAQAMARLSHPNVVPVHDVGSVGEGVFVAMEFVDGLTLRGWLDRETRPWTEVLDVMRRAALGLQAAHDAGLVHRDFKPDNVMVGADGRVRVLDFGVARSLSSQSVPEADEGSTDADDLASRGNKTLAARLTSEGAMLGTPAYMPPEQVEGLDVDARADQWSFCATLYEALYGSRPFAGSSIAASLLAMYNDGLPPPPAKSSVPRWLYDVAARGLALNPEERFPSMGELIAAMDRDPARRRRRAVFGVVGALALVGLGAFGSTLGNTSDAPDPCPDPTPELAGIWDPARSSEVEAAVRGVDLPYAEDTATRVVSSLDAYAQAWTQGKLDACEATHVRREQSGDLLDRRTACLTHGRAALKATVDVLADADSDTVMHATKVVSALPPLATCSDIEVLLADVAPPADPEVAARVEAVDAQLATITATLVAGHYDEGGAALRELMPSVLELEYGPTRAAGYRLRGNLGWAQGEYEAAEADYQTAYEEALQSGADGLAARIATELIKSVALNQRRIDEAESWLRSARALGQRVAPDGALHAHAIMYTGYLLHLKGRHAEAIPFFLDAVARLDRVDPLPMAELGEALSGLGATYDELGHYDEAQAAFERSLTVQEAYLGAEHPYIMAPLENLAVNQQAQGNYDEALVLERRVLAIWEASMPPRHPGKALTHNNIGWSLFEQGKFEDAADHFQQAMDIFTEAHDAKHARVAMAAEGLAAAKMELGEYEEARGLHARALEIRLEAVGPEHPNVAFSRMGLGDVEMKQGRWQEALAHYDAALEIVERQPDDAARVLADALRKRSLALLELQRPEDAVRDLERARELFEQGVQPDPQLLGSVRFGLARALRATNPDDPRAEALGRSAKEAYLQAQGYQRDAALAELEVFLGQRG